MSCNFYIFVDGDQFPAEAWREILTACSCQPYQGSASSPFIEEWLCGGDDSRVWVTLSAFAPERSSLSVPAWARWWIGIDFRSEDKDIFEANALVLRALGSLPARGLRVAAVDLHDMNLAVRETVAAWRENAAQWLPAETVADLVEWALE